jgi:hypothetical protein
LVGALREPAGPDPRRDPVERMAHRLKTHTAGWVTLCVSKPPNRFRHHRIRDGHSPVSHPQSGRSLKRVDSGVLGLEPQAHGKITPAVRG